VEVIPNAILFDEIVAKSRQDSAHPWLCDKKQPVILGVGRLSPEKDFLTLIRAFALARQHKAMKLIILGEGPERKALEAQAKKEGVQTDVSFPGFVQNPYAYYAKADGYVLSSKTEGFSYSLLEAMACGCSVVVTPCCDIPLKLIDYGRYGTMVPTGNAAQMAEGILKCLDQPTAPALLINQAKAYDAAQIFTHYSKVLLGSS
jgi:glycosyltransferase involved in cell wall biosynthesis